MKRKRGRPPSLLTRMRGEDGNEICPVMKYGSRAWRFLLLRQLLRDTKEKLPVNYFSAAWRKFRIRKQPGPPPPILCLWRAFIEELESAMVRDDEDWLQDFAKAIHEGVSPDGRSQFAAKVIRLLNYRMWADVTASDIYDALKKRRLPHGGGVKVEGHIFENRSRAIEAIQDIAAKIGVTLTPKRASRATEPA
jgi:hypothetical protein